MSAVHLVDATVARQQLRHLAAQGFPAVWIADRLGMGRSGVIDIRSGQRPMIRPYTALAIERLHAHLKDANPADHGITRQGASKTQYLATDRGWAS